MKLPDMARILPARRTTILRISQAIAAPLPTEKKTPTLMLFGSGGQTCTQR
jgi:hypothetical protein